MSIQNELDKIKNAVYGKEVRGAIHDGIKKAYDDSAKNGNANMEVELARGKEKTLNDRLQNLDATNKIYGEQLVKKVGGGIKANLEDLSPSVLAAIDGTGGPFNLLSIPQDYSVTPTKTTFLEPTSNLFNLNEMEMNKSLTATGQSNTAQGFALSGHINVPTSQKIVIKNVRTYGYYKSDGSFMPETYVALEGSFNEVVLPIPPSEAKTIRFNWYVPNLPVAEQVVNIGETIQPYEPAFKLNDYYIEKKKTKRSELDFFVPKAIESKNRHLPSSAIHDKFVNQANGTLATSTDYKTYVVPVREGEKITFSLHNRSAFYNENGDFIGGSGLFENTVPTGQPLTRTVPKKATVLKYSISNTVVIDGNFQLESGTEKTSFEKPGYYLPDLITENSSGSGNIAINLPSKIYATKGEELKIFNQSLFKEMNSRYNVDWDCTKGKQMDGYFSVTPDTTGNLILTIGVFDGTRQIAQKTCTIIVSNKRTTPITVLEIGDSTTHAAANAYAVKRMKDKLKTNLNLIGTQKSILDATVKYVGFGGWKAETYRSSLEGYGSPNPFYNPIKKDFDFNYYMATNGFSGVNVVIINLGINDVFGVKSDEEVNKRIESSILNLNYIIGSILEFNPFIKIALNITIPPNDHQDVFGNTPEVAVFQTQWRAKNNNFLYADGLIKNYQGIYDLIPIHAVLDTNQNINDHVHPNEQGYYQIGDQKYNYLNSL